MPKFPKISMVTRKRLEWGHIHIWWGCTYWGALQGAYCPDWDYLGPIFAFAVLDT